MNFTTTTDIAICQLVVRIDVKTVMVSLGHQQVPETFHSTNFVYSTLSGQALLLQLASLYSGSMFERRHSVAYLRMTLWFSLHG